MPNPEAVIERVAGRRKYPANLLGRFVGSRLRNNLNKNPRSLEITNRIAQRVLPLAKNRAFT